MKRLILLLCLGIFLISFTSATISTNTIITTSSNTTNSTNTNSSTWIDFDRSLVGYWAMDYYNSTGIFDNSSNNNFGRFNGGLVVSNISQGKFGDALKFDGSDDYITLSTISSMAFTNNYSFSLWVKMNNVNTLGEIFEHTITSSDRSALSPYLGEIRFGTWNGTDYYPVSGVISPNVWYHVVGIHNSNSTNYLYINNVKQTGASYPNAAGNAGNFRLGAHTSVTPTIFLNGSIDEVMIFNRSLSATEISALYDSKVNKFNASFSSLSAGQHNYSVYAIGGNGNLTTIKIQETTDRIYNKNIYMFSPENWTSSLTQPAWNYSIIPNFKILNQSKHTIFKITDAGNLAIAGKLYENTNSPPPSAKIIWKIKDFWWLDEFGNLYIKGAISLLS